MKEMVILSEGEQRAGQKGRSERATKKRRVTLNLRAWEKLNLQTKIFEKKD